MGYTRHHTIIVSSWNAEKIIDVHKKAISVFKGLVSPLINSVCNGYQSFFIAPDGSKEGWEESDSYDSKRFDFIHEINNYKYEDGSNCIRYCELFFGDDNNESRIINHN